MELRPYSVLKVWKLMLFEEQPTHSIYPLFKVYLHL